MANQIKSMNSTLIANIKNVNGLNDTALKSIDGLSFEQIIPLSSIGSITGTIVVGQILTAGALSPTGATATYQWRSSTDNSNYSDIGGATSSTYTLVITDVGKYIKVVATGSGQYSGSVTSSATTQVPTVALSSIGAITGYANVGDTLTAGIISPSNATVTYQWKYCSTEGGSYSDIGSATSSTYVVNVTYNTQYIKVVATGSGNYSGSVTSTASLQITNISYTSILYGKLYNFYCIDSGIAPSGWHVPTDVEYTTLRNALGGSGAGGHLKEAGTTHWRSPNSGADNASGFLGLPCGFRTWNTGLFYYIGDYFQSWANELYIEINGYWTLLLLYDQSNQYSAYSKKPGGRAIRLLKDDSTDPRSFTDYDGNIYRTTKIGNQVWTVGNLIVTHLANGTDISEVTDNTTWAGLTTPAFCWYNNDSGYQ